jgi:hypothetical protein
MREARNLIIALVFSLVMPGTAFGSGISCLDQAKLRSTAAGRPTIITFVNNSRHAANIYWIDYAGNRAQRFYLTSGSVISRNTLVTHPWVITDDDDNCIGVAFANPSTPNVEITDSGVVFSGTLGPALADNPAQAKQAKQDSDEAGGPQAVHAMHHDEAGTVTYRGRLGGRGGEIFSLEIGPAHEGKSWVAVYVGANGCVGDVDGQATVRGDVLELTKDEDGNACSLTIHRSATGATIAENNCVFGHGASCSFDTRGKALSRVSVATAPAAAEESRKPYCGIVHDYVDSLQFMDGKFNPCGITVLSGRPGIRTGWPHLRCFAREIAYVSTGLLRPSTEEGSELMHSRIFSA